ncbi:hypothetical protein E1A91_A11G214700v1, partial [Gossypium mustelinum]
SINISFQKLDIIVNPSPDSTIVFPLSPNPFPNNLSFQDNVGIRFHSTTISMSPFPLFSLKRTFLVFRSRSSRGLSPLPASRE